MRLRLVKCFPNDSFQRWQYDVSGDSEMRNADRNLCMEYESENLERMFLQVRAAQIQTKLGSLAKTTVTM